MKKLFLSTIIIISISYASITAVWGSSDDSLRVFCSPSLSGLVHEWAKEFNSVTPGNRIAVSINEVKSLPDNSISIVEGNNARQNENDWATAVGRDVVVPVINADNPLIAKIRSRGLSPENLALFIKEPAPGNWGTLLGTQDREKAGFYIINDESIVTALTTYLNVDIKAQGRTMMENPNELFSALEKDHLGIGFCKMASLPDNSTPEFAGKIIIAPIDRNGDGAMDHNEDIYQDMVAFSRGVWIGKYPRALTGTISAVASGPVTKSQTAFLRWILNDGQSYLGKAGFSQLLAGERQSCNDRLSEQTKTVSEAETGSVVPGLLYAFVLLILAALVISILLRNRKRNTLPQIQPVHQKILDEKSLVLPGGILYDRVHTWAFMEQDGAVKIGIDDFLRHATGEIKRIIMRNEGDFVRKGDQVLSIVRNGKHLTLYSPVSGTIREKNRRLQSDVRIMNDSPYFEGWVYRIEPSNWSAENKLLLMSDKYRIFINSEILRLKEFLAGFMNNEHPNYASVILQDGGALIDNPLDSMGPEVWEEFQIKFIDSVKTH